MDSKSSSSRPAFRSANFRRYITARFLASCASEMQSVAVGWQVYELTRRPLDLGFVGLAQFLPGICLFLITGQVADRIARNKILRACFGSFAVCSLLLLALTSAHLHSAWPIYGVLLLNGTVRAFNAPASQAILPLLVSEAEFPSAVAWASSIVQTAMVAGPLLGGLVYGITGHPTTVFGLALVSYLVAFFLMGRVTLKTATRAVTKAGTLVWEGLRYIFGNRLILGAISLDLFAVLLGGAVALLPVYAQDILHIGAVGLGILRGAPAVGAVLMAALLAGRPLQRRAGRIMLGCVFAFGVFTVLFGLSKSVWLSLIMLILIGACDMVSVVVRHTLVQLATPDAMRGRVSAVNTVFISASNEVGQFESGLTAHWLGAVPSVVAGGFGTMAVVLAWTLLFPALRRVDRLTQETIAAH